MRQQRTITAADGGEDAAMTDHRTEHAALVALLRPWQFGGGPAPQAAPTHQT